MIQVKRFLPFQAILQFLMVGWLSLAIINAKIEAAAPVITEGPTTSVAMSKNGVPTAFALTLNATDSENDTLTWSILAGAANGNAIVSSTPTGTFQEIQYTPNTDFSGNDSFEVQVSDGIATASITVNVQIDAVNNSPAINEDTKLLALNGTTEDYFGYSVAISGNLAIVGCPRDDDGSMNSGSAYVYTRTAGNTWMQQFKLTALDSEADDEFGYSVAISGNLAIVGSPSDDDGGVNSGSAYVYATSGNTWVQQCKLSASDPAQEDLFGLTVAISGNIAIVGCSMDDDGSTTDAGSAYVYANTTGNTWVQQCKLSASDLAANDRFGCSVAVSGNLVIVGSFWDDDSATDSGSAYIYANTTGNTWIQQCKLYASDPSMNDNFGFSVAISGNLAIVGSAADDDAGTSSGSAYIYANTTGNNWVHQFKLNASGAAGGDQFGYSVAISGNLALVGCYGDDDAGTDSGSAYVYANTTGNTWVEQTKLTASDAAAGDNFGSCLAISGNNVIVSSVFDDYAGPITGSAYAFSLPLTITSPVVPFASIGPEANASEGGGYTGSHYTVVISSPVVTDTTINIAISGTATNTDYTLSGDNVTWAGGASVIVVIAAGTTSSAIILTPVDDAIAEGGETVALMLDDGIGYTHDLATSMIFIFDNENSAPVITEGPSASVTMSQNGTPTNFALTLHATDADIVSANYDSLTWSILGVATNGTASVSSTTPTGSFQEIQYTPNTDFLGNDSFDIQVCDGTDSATITVNVTILAIYDVPIINENAKLFALDGEADDNFGFSVAISGNLAIVGSPGEDHVGDCSGAAYIYARTENNTWVQQFKLTALDAAVWSSFGNAVAISGNLAIVGSWADDSNGYDSGSAYVFASTSGNTWIQQCKLTSSNPQTEDYFGISVAISGNIVIVGNVLDDDGGSNAGSAYVYANTNGNTWTQQCKLHAFDPAEGDNFGHSVAISGNLAIVGSLNDDDNGSDSGSAYIFANTTGNTWIQQCKLNASDPGAYNLFGISVSISGHLAVVGSSGDDDNGSNSGSAYVYVNTNGNTWVQQCKLSDSDSGDEFGHSVAISDNLAIVGSYLDGDNGSESGAVYIYANTTGSTWVQQFKLCDSTGTGGDRLGNSVAISENLVIAGCYWDDVGLDNNSGSASIFTLSSVTVPATVPFASVEHDPFSSENGSDIGSYTIMLTSPVSTDITINIDLLGTASTADYMLSGANVTWTGGYSVIVVIAAGTTSSTVIVTPIDDNITEGTERLDLSLVSDPSYTNANSTYHLYIQDDENSAPIITEGAGVNVTMSKNAVPTPFSLVLHATDADMMDNLTWSIFDVAINGTASVSSTTPTGSFQDIQYTPNTDFVGTDSFVVQVSDGLSTNFIYVNITVTEAYEHQKSSIATGQRTVFGIANDQQCYSAGSNEVNQLGRTGNPGIAEPIISDPIVAVSVGARHGLALTQSRSVITWGANEAGQSNTSGSVETETSLFNVLQIEAGAYSSFVLSAGNQLYAKGKNNFGQLGIGSNNNVSTWTQVTLPAGNIQDVSSGIEHTLVLIDGSIYGAGSNGFAQLANNDKSIINNLFVLIDNTRVWKDVEAGGFHSMAIDNSGHVWCWGKNNEGQLGLGHTNAVNTPTEVTTLYNVQSISGGYAHSMFLTQVDADRSCFIAGDNHQGQLAQRGLNRNSTPQMVGEYVDVNEISAGAFTSLILRANHVEIWGQLPDSRNSSNPEVFMDMTVNSNQVEKFLGAGGAGLVD